MGRTNVTFLRNKDKAKETTNRDNKTGRGTIKRRWTSDPDDETYGDTCLFFPCNFVSLITTSSIGFFFSSSVFLPNSFLNFKCNFKFLFFKLLFLLSYNRCTWVGRMSLTPVTLHLLKYSLVQ